MNSSSDSGKKVVLISGGAKGIGAATARYFHRAGYIVALNYFSSQPEAETLKKEIQRENGKIDLFQADVSDATERRLMLEKIEACYPDGISVLVNNAGAYGREPFEVLTDTSFEECLNANLKTGVFLTRDCLKLLRKKTGSSIIFISSGSAFSYTKESACFSYAVAKAAVIGATKALAVELAPELRVNCIVPTYIQTDMVSSLSDEEVLKKKERTLLKKIGNPNDVAAAIFFLASEEAGYITGQSVHVNGGRYLA